MISKESKLRFWNHFTNDAQKSFRPKKITDIRLRQIKEIVLNDDALWQRVVSHRASPSEIPEALKLSAPSDYERARSAFWVMVRKKINSQATN